MNARRPVAKHPEYPLLEAVFGTALAVRITTAAGDWRTLTVHEMVGIGLDEDEARGITALQALAQRSYSPAGPVLGCSEEVGRIYADRLAGLEHEVILAVAVDGRNRVIHEIEIGRGGLHGAAIRPADVFRPLIRAGASAFILVHNHPSGDPSPEPRRRDHDPRGRDARQHRRPAAARPRGRGRSGRRLPIHVRPRDPRTTGARR